jgi:hypothetical protein
VVSRVMGVVIICNTRTIDRENALFSIVVVEITFSRYAGETMQMSKRRRKRSKDNKTIYYYSLQQLQIDPDSGQWQVLKRQLGKRLLDWIEDR